MQHNITEKEFGDDDLDCQLEAYLGYIEAMLFLPQ